MKLNKAFLAGAFALAVLSGCGSSDSPQAPGAAVAPNAEETPVNEGPALGTPASRMDLNGRTLMIDGVAVEGTDDNHFQGFPVLASRVSEAWGATRAIKTTEGNLEVYSGDTLLFIISGTEGSYRISYSRNGFMADSISWSESTGAGEQGQSHNMGLLKLTLSECMVDQGQDKGEQEAPDQGEKAPDQGEKAPDQGEKAPDQGEKAPDQGEKAPDQGEKAPDQGEKAPDQGEKAPDQGEKAPKEQICKTAIVELSFMEVISKEPDQGQKAPDQGEKAPDQGEKAPDQGEKAPDQGEKAPDQGEPVQEEPVKEEPVKEEPKQEEPKQEEPKQEEPVKEEPKQGQK